MFNLRSLHSPCALYAPGLFQSIKPERATRAFLPYPLLNRQWPPLCIQKDDYGLKNPENLWLIELIDLRHTSFRLLALGQSAKGRTIGLKCSILGSGIIFHLRFRIFHGHRGITVLCTVT